MVASWLGGLWRLLSDTLGSSPAVAGFSLFSFLSQQAEFQLTFVICLFCWLSSGPYVLVVSLPNRLKLPTLTQVMLLPVNMLLRRYTL